MSKILMIIAPINFRDEEYFEPKKIFEKSGHTVITASQVIGKIIGSHGKTTISEISLDNINPNDYDCLVLVGGQGSYAYDNNQIVHKIAQTFNLQSKLIGAICHAPIIIAKAGLLKDKEATVFAGDAPELSSLIVNYIDKPVVEDKNIITANGPQSATLFGKAISSRLAE
jgi:protease I